MAAGVGSGDAVEDGMGTGVAVRSGSGVEEGVGDGGICVGERVGGFEVSEGAVRICEAGRRVGVSNMG